MNRSLCFVAFLGVTTAYFGATTPAFAAEYEYTAITEVPVSVTLSAVQSGSLTWRCKGNKCSVRGPWPKPALSACKALAQKVGPLRSYGQSAAQLNAKEMAQCNAGLSAATTASTHSNATLQSLTGSGNNPLARQDEPRAEVANVLKQSDTRVLVPAQTDLINTLGPVIRNFARNKSCPYPDPRARILSYRVNPAPDGASVARIQIWRNLATGAAEKAFEYPGAGGAKTQLRENDAVVDTTAHAATVAYTLQATDSKGRSTSQRLPYNYRAMPTAGREVSIAQADLVFDSAARRNQVELSVVSQGVAISGLTMNLKGYRSPSARESVSRSGIPVEVVGQSLPIGFSNEPRTFRLRSTDNGNIASSYEWSAELVVEIARPALCSGAVDLPVLRVATARQRGSSPPPRIGGGHRSGGCEGEGDACTVRPAECSGREPGFEVPGRMVCESGRAVCQAEAGRDYCNACGGVCGACVSEICSAGNPCAPGATCAPQYTCAPGAPCGRDTPGTGDVGVLMACQDRNTSTGRLLCQPRNDICWLPDELDYAPTGTESVYYQFCAP